MGKDKKSWFGKITNTDRIAILILCIGFIGFLFLPFIVTQKDWANRYFDFSFGVLEPNQIGDMIGGIVGPFIGLISASLVYLTIREQISANKLIQTQFKNEEVTRYEKVIFDEVIKDVNDVVEKIKNIKGTSLNEYFQNLSNEEKISKIAYASIFDDGNLSFEFKDNSEILVFKALFKKFVESLELFCTNIKHDKGFYKIVELKNNKINVYIESSIVEVKKNMDSHNKNGISNLCKWEYSEIFDYLKKYIEDSRKIKLKNKGENNVDTDNFKVFFEIIDFLKQYKDLMKKIEFTVAQKLGLFFNKGQYASVEAKIDHSNQSKLNSQEYDSLTIELENLIDNLVKKNIIVKETFLSNHTNLYIRINEKNSYSIKIIK